MMYEIYTDGSCIGNPGPGGWAFLVINVNHSHDEGPMSGIIHQQSGSAKETTNNRMEMTALIRALEYALSKKLGKVRIYSDSTLLVNTINDGWKRKANLDLWLEIEKLLGRVKIELRWVKAHDKSLFNNMVDELAQKAATKP